MAVQTWERQGSARLPYVITLREDGRLSCTCPGWTFQRNGQPRSCKHTREVIASSGYAVEQRQDGEYITLAAPLVGAGPIHVLPPTKARRSSGPAPEYRPLMLAAEDKGLRWDRISAAEWAMEQKFDGERCLVAVRAGTVTAWSRAGGGRDVGLGRDLSPQIVAAMATLPDGDYDGEVIVAGAGMKSSDVKAIVNRAKQMFVAFDLLMLSGRDLTGETYETRRELLRATIQTERQPSDALFLASSEDPDERMYRAIVDAGGEGVILKRRASTYTGRRSDDWLKVKARGEAIGTITGFETSKVNGGKNAVVLFTLPSGVACRAKTPTMEFGRRVVAGEIAIGTKIEVEYQTLLASGKPRHAMIKRVVGEA